MPKTDNNSYRHILKYMGIFGGVQGLNILMSIVTSMGYVGHHADTSPRVLWGDAPHANL